MHLEVKRVVEGDKNICYVLQEKAKGKCFSVYNAYGNDSKTQLKLQEVLANAPDSHYEKCISDICELFNMGLETKPKNIFYDDAKENGGFTFIDLLNYDSTPLNPNSIKDIFMLNNYASFIYNFSSISIYNKEASEYEKKKSIELSNMIRLKIYLAMEKVIPNFKQHKRWLLRSYSKDVLNFFEANGIEVGDLRLTDLEYDQFNKTVEMIITSSLEKLASGKYQLWQIFINEIRIDLDNMGMQYAWKYHKLNDIKQEDFDDLYDYNYSCEKYLETKVKELFVERLEMLAINTENQYILNAKNELDKTREKSKGL